jgi:phosphoribosylcarboxyaminoimidazole (NCAIR) mutase
MKKMFVSTLITSAMACLAVVPANAAPVGAADNNSTNSIGSPIPTPSLVPMAANAINGLIQAETLHQKMAEDREAAEKRLAADKAAAEQSAALKAPIENVAVVSDLAVPESIELPEIETPD